MTPSAIAHYSGPMARWEPDAQGRLKQAAFTLFVERGYADVTVAEIADRAGLTKRTFFNHFADKRDVLFAGADALEASIVQHLVDAEADLDPLDAAVLALTRASQELAAYGDSARDRRDLIASSHELQERDRIKMASLARAVAETLEERGVTARDATLTAQVALAVFDTAFDDWVEDTTRDVETLMQRALADVRRVVVGCRTAGSNLRSG
jgi:AcrR family transcriptional regulator